MSKKKTSETSKTSEANEKRVQFEWAKTADLLPYARNSRTHTEEQINKVASSIREFGFLSPVVIDSDNTILAGHCRVAAAHKLGLLGLPIVRAAHLTEAQKRAYVIADNRLALDAGWDNQMLRVELLDLQKEKFDLNLLGFTDIEIEDVLTQLDTNENLEEPKSIEPKLLDQIALIVLCKNENEQKELFEELRERSFEVKIP